MYSKKYQTLEEAYLNFYEGRGSRGETSADSEELARKIARRAKKNPQNTDKYWSGVLRLAGRAPSGSSVIDNAKREFIKKEDLDIVSNYLLDEGEKPYPYGKVGDKLRSLEAQMKAAKTPKQKNRIAERQKNINKEYNVPMEQVDLYDLVLSHLLDEGYAETYEAAEKIMVNMSEDWRESIVEEVLDEGRADKKAPPEYRAKLRNARAGFITLSGANATKARRSEHKGRRGERGNIGGEGGSSYRYDDNADKDYPSFRVRGRGYA